jgi:hypothetical protein
MAATVAPGRAALRRGSAHGLLYHHAGHGRAGYRRDCIALQVAQRIRRRSAHDPTPGLCLVQKLEKDRGKLRLNQGFLRDGLDQLRYLERVLCQEISPDCQSCRRYENQNTRARTPATLRTSGVKTGPWQRPSLPTPSRPDRITSPRGEGLSSPHRLGRLVSWKSLPVLQQRQPATEVRSRRNG